jgi:hypothetical protein
VESTVAVAEREILEPELLVEGLRTRTVDGGKQDRPVVAHAGRVDEMWREDVGLFQERVGGTDVVGVAVERADK